MVMFTICISFLFFLFSFDSQFLSYFVGPLIYTYLPRIPSVPKIFLPFSLLLQVTVVIVLGPQDVATTTWIANLARMMPLVSCVKWARCQSIQKRKALRMAPYLMRALCYSTALGVPTHFTFPVMIHLCGMFLVSVISGSAVIAVEKRACAPWN